MVIVEGPDGCGKTVLTGLISKKFPSMKVETHGDRRLLHRTNVRGRVYDALAEAVRGLDPPVVHDRLYFSEMVYGPILRSSCKFNTKEVLFIDAMLNLLQCPIVFCLPPGDWGRRNVEVDFEAMKNDRSKRAKLPHLEGVLEHYEHLHLAYARLFREYRGLGHNVWSFDPSSMEMSFLFEHIRLYYKTRQARMWNGEREAA